MVLPNAERALRALARLLLLVVLFLAAPLNAAGQAGGEAARGSFRWIHPSSDPRLWKQIRTAFQHELEPDEAKPEADWRDVYQFNFLQKVGVMGHSALVIIGHRPAKAVSKEDAWDTFSSAFNFDLSTGRKSLIESSGRMWQWKFRWLATFGPTSIPDVTFTYLTCTECEPSEIFSSFYYQGTASAWHIRTWGNGKDVWWAAPNGLVVGVDLIEGEGTLLFDCVYGLVPMGRELKGLAVRCKEVTEGETGRAKIDDVTLLYITSHGKFRPRIVNDPSVIAELTAKVCRPGSQSMLCKLPAFLTITSGQNSAIDDMFPARRETSRSLADFRIVKDAKSMMDVVGQCGQPDEIGGSGLAIFIYHLYDGSLVVIGTTGATDPILYANHIEPDGKTTSLIPTK